MACLTSPSPTMAANPTPTNDQVLLARMSDVISGCHALEMEIGLKQNTAATLQQVLDEARAALAEVGRLKTARGQRRKELLQRDREGEQAISRCRLRLAMLFGISYNVNWGAAGFPDNSTMVPEVFAKRLSLLHKLALHLELKPEHESSDMQATAAVCHATFEALSDARSAVNRSQSALRTAVIAKNQAMKKLRKRLRGLIRELGQLLSPEDGRWRQFGLNRPAQETMPVPVEQVTLTAMGGGQVLAQWPPAPHATRYRVQSRVAGSDEFQAEATVHDKECLLSGKTPGETLEVRVIAANSMDEAAPCPATGVTVN